MLAQFHVISPRGDCIITRDFRHDAPSGTADVFFRKARSWEHGAPPIFTVENVHYTFVDKAGIYFVFTSLSSLSACWTIELLNKLVKSFKDFCGVLSEESLRRNFILIYELIDEIIDSGYPQTTASEVLKLSVHSEALDTTSNGTSNVFLRGLSLRTTPASTVPSWANQRPIGVVSASSSPLGSIISTLPLGEPVAKNEIFVDIMERLNVVMDFTGTVLSSLIDGSIQMKSYLSGNPSLRVSLNEDLIVSSEENQKQQTYSSSLILDDANFHECADLSEFDRRIITLVPPDGEFVLMNYRISKGVKLPFRVTPTMNFFSDRVEISIIIRADIPDQNYGSAMTVSVPLICPESTIRSVEGASYQPGKLFWSIPKLVGGQEIVSRAKIYLNPSQSTSVIGSAVSLAFEIPMYSCSNMQVRYLRIQDRGDSPFRWVRYVTQSNSYRHALGDK